MALKCSECGQDTPAKVIYFVCACACACVCVCVCVCVCLCVCASGHTYAHACLCTLPVDHPINQSTTEEDSNNTLDGKQEEDATRCPGACTEKPSFTIRSFTILVKQILEISDIQSILSCPLYKL